MKTADFANQMSAFEIEIYFRNGHCVHDKLDSFQQRMEFHEWSKNVVSQNSFSKKEKHI